MYQKNKQKVWCDINNIWSGTTDMHLWKTIICEKDKSTSRESAFYPHLSAVIMLPPALCPLCPNLHTPSNLNCSGESVSVLLHKNLHQGQAQCSDCQKSQPVKFHSRTSFKIHHTSLALHLRHIWCLRMHVYFLRNHLTILFSQN